MNKYNFKFEIVKKIPTNTEMAEDLSAQMTNDYGINGWELVGITSIPASSPPGMLLTFQKVGSSD